VIGIYEPNLAALIPHISPKLILFQTIIIPMPKTGSYAGNAPIPTTLF
jgi:hypothetical protein